MALAEKKRQQRQKVILMAAADVFKRKGFDGAKIEDIAERANVAPGTVYNYFPTKDALLLALVMLFRTETRAERVAFVNDPPSDPYIAFSTLYNRMVDGTLKYLDRSLWRHAQVASIASSWEPGRRDIWENEYELIREQTKMLEILKKRGALPESVDPDAWAKAIHAIGYFWFQRFLADDNVSLAQTKRVMTEQFSRLLPKKETTRRRGQLKNSASPNRSAKTRAD